MTPNSWRRWDPIGCCSCRTAHWTTGTTACWTWSRSRSRCLTRSLPGAGQPPARVGGMHRFLAIAAVGMALVVSACHGGTPDAAASRTPAPGASGAASAPPASNPPKQAKAVKVDPRRGGLEVGFGEFAVVPEAKAIRPGKVTLVVRNGGQLTHGFEMKDDDGLESGKNDGRRLKVEGPRFGPGETYRLTVTLAPGRYELECYVANHDDLGM